MSLASHKTKATHTHTHTPWLWGWNTDKRLVVTTYIKTFKVNNSI